MKMKKRTIDYCRSYYELQDNVSDADISEKLYGSLGCSLGELHHSVNELKSAIKTCLPDWIKRVIRISA